jgi:aminobenzoyl-glutamate utilization protein B
MLLAAKALALAGLDLLTRPDLLAAAQAEFKRKINGKPYVSPIPEGTVPH